MQLQDLTKVWGGGNIDVSINSEVIFMSEKLNSGEQIQDNGELNEWEEMAKNAPEFMGSGSKGLETHAGPDATPMGVTEAPEGRRIVSADGEYIPETPTPGHDSAPTEIMEMVPPEPMQLGEEPTPTPDETPAYTPDETTPDMPETPSLPPEFNADLSNPNSRTGEDVHLSKKKMKGIFKSIKRNMEKQ